LVALGTEFDHLDVRSGECSFKAFCDAVVADVGGDGELGTFKRKS
jgi:hypothetical protein